MPKFRKKPVVVEAEQWTGYTTREIIRWICEASVPWALVPNPAGNDRPGTLEIMTLEGRMTALPGDWIIRGIKGELYPIKPDIFEATYEPA